MKDRAQHPLPLSAQMSKWGPRESAVWGHTARQVQCQPPLGPVQAAELTHEKLRLPRDCGRGPHGSLACSPQPAFWAGRGDCCSCVRRQCPHSSSQMGTARIADLQDPEPLGTWLGLR